MRYLENIKVKVTVIYRIKNVIMLTKAQLPHFDNLKHILENFEFTLLSLCYIEISKSSMHFLCLIAIKQLEF